MIRNGTHNFFSTSEQYLINKLTKKNHCQKKLTGWFCFWARLQYPDQEYIYVAIHVGKKDLSNSKQIKVIRKDLSNSKQIKVIRKDLSSSKQIKVMGEDISNSKQFKVIIKELSNSKQIRIIIKDLHIQ